MALTTEEVMREKSFFARIGSKNVCFAGDKVRMKRDFPLKMAWAAYL